MRRRPLYVLSGRRAREGAKRAADVAASAALLAGLSPALAFTAALVRWRLGGPVVFRQTRPGRDGEPFTIFKFRTMADGLDADGQLLPDADRLTRLGRVLRTTSLDELPELWNVIRGDMSLVGPRPLLVRYTPFLREEERLRLAVRPGITGWAQVNGRNNAAWDERLALDVWYVRNWSLALDLKILARTVRGVLRGDGVVVDPSSTLANLDDERRAQQG